MRDLFVGILLPVQPVSIILFTFYCLDRVFKYEYKNRKTALIVSLIAALVTGAAVDIAHFCVPESDTSSAAGDIALMAGLAIHALILMFLLKGKIWKRVLAVFLTSEIINTINMIFTNIQSQVFSLLEWPDRYLLLIAFLLMEFFAILLEFFFLVLIGRIRRKSDNTPLPLPFIAIIAVSLQLITGFLLDEDTGDTLASDIGVIRTVALLMLLVILILFFYIRVTRKERDGLKDMNKINAELIESQTKYFEASAKADSEIRSMRHDMKNNIQVLMLLLENKEYDKMREYLEEMGEGLAVTDVSSHTGDVIADAIIADKKARAASAGVELKVTGTISGVEISPVNMCRMLGNLLDNAIEAAGDGRLKDLPSDLRVIDLQFRRTDNFFMISVTNPCAECPNIEDGMIVTSKSDRKNHGFGIQNIRGAAEECGGELSVSCEERPFGYLFRAEVVM